MNTFRDLNKEKEQEFRQWARDNYKVLSQVDDLWHSVVKDECNKMNMEVVEKHPVKFSKEDYSSNFSKLVNEFVTLKLNNYPMYDKLRYPKITGLLQEMLAECLSGGVVDVLNKINKYVESNKSKK